MHTIHTCTPVPFPNKDGDDNVDGDEEYDLHGDEDCPGQVRMCSMHVWYVCI